MRGRTALLGTFILLPHKGNSNRVDGLRSTKPVTESRKPVVDITDKQAKGVSGQHSRLFLEMSKGITAPAEINPSKLLTLFRQLPLYTATSALEALSQKKRSLDVLKVQLSQLGLADNANRILDKVGEKLQKLHDHFETLSSPETLTSTYDPYFERPAVRKLITTTLRDQFELIEGLSGMLSSVNVPLRVKPAELRGPEDASSHIDRCLSHYEKQCYVLLSLIERFQERVEEVQAMVRAHNLIAWFDALALFEEVSDTEDVSVKEEALGTKIDFICRSYMLPGMLEEVKSNLENRDLKSPEWRQFLLLQVMGLIENFENTPEYTEVLSFYLKELADTLSGQVLQEVTKADKNLKDLFSQPANPEDLLKIQECLDLLRHSLREWLPVSPALVSEAVDAICRTELNGSVRNGHTLNSILAQASSRTDYFMKQVADIVHDLATDVQQLTSTGKISGYSSRNTVVDTVPGEKREELITALLRETEEELKITEEALRQWRQLELIARKEKIRPLSYPNVQNQENIPPVVRTAECRKELADVLAKVNGETGKIQKPFLGKSPADTLQALISRYGELAVFHSMVELRGEVAFNFLMDKTVHRDFYEKVLQDAVLTQDVRSLDVLLAGWIGDNSDRCRLFAKSCAYADMNVARVFLRYVPLFGNSADDLSAYRAAAEAGRTDIMDMIDRELAPAQTKNKPVPAEYSQVFFDALCRGNLRVAAYVAGVYPEVMSVSNAVPVNNETVLVDCIQRGDFLSCQLFLLLLQGGPDKMARKWMNRSSRSGESPFQLVLLKERDSLNALADYLQCSISEADKLVADYLSLPRTDENALETALKKSEINGAVPDMLYDMLTEAAAWRQTAALMTPYLSVSRELDRVVRASRVTTADDRWLERLPFETLPSAEQLTILRQLIASDKADIVLRLLPKTDLSAPLPTPLLTAFQKADEEGKIKIFTKRNYDGKPALPLEDMRLLYYVSDESLRGVLLDHFQDFPYLVRKIPAGLNDRRPPSIGLALLQQAVSTGNKGLAAAILDRSPEVLLSWLSEHTPVREYDSRKHPLLLAAESPGDPKEMVTLILEAMGRPPVSDVLRRERGLPESASANEVLKEALKTIVTPRESMLTGNAAFRATGGETVFHLLTEKHRPLFYDLAESGIYEPVMSANGLTPDDDMVRTFLLGQAVSPAEPLLLFVSEQELALRSVPAKELFLSRLSHFCKLIHDNKGQPDADTLYARLAVAGFTETTFVAGISFAEFHKMEKVIGSDLYHLLLDHGYRQTPGKALKAQLYDVAIAHGLDEQQLCDGLNIPKDRIKQVMMTPLYQFTVETLRHSPDIDFGKLGTAFLKEIGLEEEFSTETEASEEVPPHYLISSDHPDSSLPRSVFGCGLEDRAFSFRQLPDSEQNLVK